MQLKPITVLAMFAGAIAGQVIGALLWHWLTR